MKYDQTNPRSCQRAVGCCLLLLDADAAPVGLFSDALTCYAMAVPQAEDVAEAVMLAVKTKQVGSTTPTLTFLSDMATVVLVCAAPPITSQSCCAMHMRSPAHRWTSCCVLPSQHRDDAGVYFTTLRFGLDTPVLAGE
jgi:hypothetical protein